MPIVRGAAARGEPAAPGTMPPMPRTPSTRSSHRFRPARRRSSTALVLPLDGSRVLLGRKRFGFGEGRLTTLGGGVEPGEGTEATARRELEEEAGIVAHELERVGGFAFRFANRPGWELQAVVFVTRSWSGVVRPSREIEPEWHPAHAPPYREMWPDSRYWLPRVLAGEAVGARFVYLDGDTLEVVSLRSWDRGRPARDDAALERLRELAGPSAARRDTHEAGSAS